MLTQQQELIILSMDYIRLIHLKKLHQYFIKSNIDVDISSVKDKIFQVMSKILTNLTGEILEKGSEIWYHLKLSIIKFYESLNISNISEYGKLWRSKKILKSLHRINPNNNGLINQIMNINHHMDGMYNDFININIDNYKPKGDGLYEYYNSKIDFFTIECQPN
ncbi:MAG: hypothetical protein QM487_02825 [Candidatus Marithrix sp.]